MSRTRADDHQGSTLAVVPLRVVVAPRARVLASDADRLRSLLAQGRRTLVEITDLLTRIRDREGWTTRQLAEWCQSEGVGFESHERVGQVLRYGRTVAALGTAVPKNDPPTERTLRPLTQALSAGLPAEEAVAVWEKVTAEPTPPTAERVAEVVEALPFVKRQRRARKRARREAEASRVGRSMTALDYCKSAIRRFATPMADAVGAELPWGELTVEEYEWVVTEGRKACERFFTSVQQQRTDYEEALGSCLHGADEVG